MNRKFLIVLVLSILNIKTSAQEEKETKLEISSFYQNNMQYLGRLNSEKKQPLLIPELKLSLKNGFYADAEFYVSPKKKNFEGGNIAIGYEFYEEKWGASFDVSEYFFSKNSVLIRSNINTTIDASFYYDFDIFVINVEPSYIFGNNGEFVLGTGVSNEYVFENIGRNGKIKIEPKLFTWIGNENFAIQHAYKLKNTIANPLNSKDANKYKLMSVEASVPIEYFLDENWKFKVEPQLVFPYNYKNLGSFYALSSYPNPMLIIKIGVSYVIK